MPIDPTGQTDQTTNVPRDPTRIVPTDQATIVPREAKRITKKPNVQIKRAVRGRSRNQVENITIEFTKIFVWILRILIAP